MRAPLWETWSVIHTNVPPSCPHRDWAKLLKSARGWGEEIRKSIVGWEK
jgi:hypothetical protein